MDNIDVRVRKKYRIMLPNADELLYDRCMQKALSIYGDPLPVEVSDRFNSEFDAVSWHNYSSNYLIGAEMADISKGLGYPVSTRGMMGSSFLSYLCGFSSVNPLPAHYYCPKCHHFELVGGMDDFRLNGFDLQDECCPVCGTRMKSDGAAIMPEVLLGANMNREPDVMINYAPRVRNRVIQEFKDRFDEYQFFRAGTCVNRPDGTVFRGIHPGGVFIVPPGVDIERITELRECDEADEFQMPISCMDYHDIDPVFKKYDILSLPELEILHDLEQVSGVPYDDICISDPRLLDVFEENGFSFIPIHVFHEVEEGYSDHALRRVVERGGCNGFSDIARLDSALHGVNVWTDNVENLIGDNHAFRDLVCCRDDILQFLISLGIDMVDAFRVMNDVRRGRGISKENEYLMRAADVPDWYIESCNKIRYLFPKAHSVEYTIIYFKLAFYKLNYPEEYNKVMDSLPH